jgi:hypothetical protein
MSMSCAPLTSIKGHRSVADGVAMRHREAAKAARHYHRGKQPLDQFDITFLDLSKMEAGVRCIFVTTHIELQSNGGREITPVVEAKQIQFESALDGRCRRCGRIRKILQCCATSAATLSFTPKGGCRSQPRAAMAS